jgi:hypothetical protein
LVLIQNGQQERYWNTEFLPNKDQLARQKSLQRCRTSSIARRVTGCDLALQAGIVQRVNELRTIRSEIVGRRCALGRSSRIIGT